MRPRIPRNQLLAFARECLKLEQLLSEPEGLAELRKFLNLVKSMEKGGGVAALEALLRPESTGLATTWDTEVASAAKEATPLLKDALHPLPATPTSPTKDTH